MPQYIQYLGGELMRVYGIKKFEVTFVRHWPESDWKLVVAANSATKAIAIAYIHYIREELSPQDVEDIRTERADSYL